MLVTANGEKSLLIEGGCNGGKACRYMVLYAFFSDKVSLDFNLLNKLNADYDLIKVWINADGKLAYTMGLMNVGLTRAHFRASLDQLIAAQGDLARDLIAAKAIKEEAPQPKK